MNRKKYRIVAACMTLLMALGTVLPGSVAKADSESVPYLALGADLSVGERETVFSLLNVDPANLDAYNVLYVTNADEHNYLDNYIDSSIIGSRALSCVLIQKRTEGYGLQVTTHNITYCTSSMYVNALSTAGITDSRVVVAGPFPISGTAALVGAMKAYEDMTGEEISEEFQDTAMNELVVEGAIGESFGDDYEDSREIEEFILDLKIEVSEREFDEATERAELEALIRERATQRNLELSEEILNQLIDLMVKINDLNLDTSQIQQQTETITEPAASTEAAGQDQAASTEAAAKPQTASTEAAPGASNEDQIISQGQEQIEAFNSFFQDEDKTLGLTAAIQDDISQLKEAGEEVTEDQKKEIIVREFVNYGIIPAEEAEGDLSAYDGQVNNTLLIIDNIDLFGLDLEGYRERMAKTQESTEVPGESTEAAGEETGATETASPDETVENSAEGGTGQE